MDLIIYRLASYFLWAGKGRHDLLQLLVLHVEKLTCWSKCERREILNSLLSTKSGMLIFWQLKSSAFSRSMWCSYLNCYFHFPPARSSSADLIDFDTDWFLKNPYIIAFIVKPFNIIGISEIIQYSTEFTDVLFNKIEISDGIPLKQR